MAIFIGGAWPYANGSLHLGHISSLLPGDILARYFRLKGEKVLYVSGSDCNGTPIAIKAKQENVTIEEIANKYHLEFKECFNKLGFTYDNYTRTDSKQHHEVVQDIFLELQKNGFIYKKEISQTFCEFDAQFLPDRYVEGLCPKCLNLTRGDQCDNCSTILDPLELLDRKCKLCGNEPITKKTEHFYFSLSKFQVLLENYVKKAKEKENWRENAINLTERYLLEGLHDRAVSRDLPNGVSIPIMGYENKKIYVWIEAVSGYYSASKEWSNQLQVDINEYWNKNTVSYYVHGKDNIPFHTVIWPAILMGINKNSLPTHIISNEYLTLEKKKLSTSKNWAVWIPYIIKKYHPDSVRYFLTTNAPENRDTDFSWREFILSHNSELLGAYGNFVNRTLKFIEKSFDGKISNGEVNSEIKMNVLTLYNKVGELIETGQMKKAIDTIFEFIRSSNKYFDSEQPWKQINNDRNSCINTIFTSIYIVSNVSQILFPFLPHSSKKVQQMLGIKENSWSEINQSSYELLAVSPLFERLDINLIESEIEYLNNQVKE